MGYCKQIDLMEERHAAVDELQSMLDNAGFSLDVRDAVAFLVESDWDVEAAYDAFIGQYDGGWKSEAMTAWERNR